MNYQYLADAPDYKGLEVTSDQAETREHGLTIQRFGGFISLGGAIMLMTVRVKGKTEAQRKKAKLARLIMVGGGLGVFALSQMETA